MSETAQAYNWIEATLSADSTLTSLGVSAFQEYAPNGTAAPYIIFQQQASTDVNTVNGVRLFTNKLMQIKVVGPDGSFPALITIADRIDANFQNVRDVSLSSGGILSCNREQEISLCQIINGLPWSQLGGLYRIQLQGA